MASQAPVRIVVFRNQNESKAFEISPHWIYWLGGLVSFLTMVTAVSVVYGTAMWARSKASQPARLQELEVQISDLKAQLEAIKTAPAPAPATVPVIAVAKPPVVEPALVLSVPTQVPAPAPAPVAAPAPEPTYGFGPLSMVKITVAPPLPPPAALPATKTSAATRAIPESLLASVPQRKSLRITVTRARLRVRSKSLTFNFALQYSAKDGGNQQGRIVVMAREPSKIASYPDASIAKEFESGGTITWEKGEYFSVSRFRAVQGKIPLNANTVQGIEILLFDTDGNLIYYDSPKLEDEGEEE